MTILKKIHNLTLLARCFARALARGKADKLSRPVSRIIVAPAGKLGDVVCTTPVLRAIRERLPGAEIIAAGPAELHKALLSDSGLIDRYLSLEEDGAEARVRACNADAAILTGPSFSDAALFYLAGVPLIVAPVVHGGFSPYETRPYKMLRRLIRTFPYRMGEYAPRERLRALEPLGIFANNTTKRLGFSEIAEKRIDRFFADNGVDTGKDFLVGITPSAGNKIKEWPEERFAEVADHLAEKYRARIILVGGPADAKRVANVISRMRNARTAVNTQGMFSLDELKAFISKLDLFISVDTGPIYIAEAFDIPTVDIVGPMSEHEQPPQGRVHRVVTPPSRERSQLFILNSRAYDTDEAKRQTLSITAATVIAAVDDLLRNIRAGGKG